MKVLTSVGLAVANIFNDGLVPQLFNVGGGVIAGAIVILLIQGIKRVVR